MLQVLVVASLLLVRFGGVDSQPVNNQLFSHTACFQIINSTQITLGSLDSTLFCLAAVGGFSLLLAASILSHLVWRPDQVRGV